MNVIVSEFDGDIKTKIDELKNKYEKVIILLENFKASLLFEISFPPAVAKSSRPPPFPPTIKAVCFTKSPAFIVAFLTPAQSVILSSLIFSSKI